MYYVSQQFKGTFICKLTNFYWPLRRLLRQMCCLTCVHHIPPIVQTTASIGHKDIQYVSDRSYSHIHSSVNWKFKRERPPTVACRHVATDYNCLRVFSPIAARPALCLTFCTAYKLRLAFPVLRTVSVSLYKSWPGVLKTEATAASDVRSYAVSWASIRS